MNVEILKHPTEEDWKLCQTCTLVTVSKKAVKPPTELWKIRLLRQITPQLELWNSVSD